MDDAICITRIGRRRKAAIFTAVRAIAAALAVLAAPAAFSSVSMIEPELETVPYLRPITSCCFCYRLAGDGLINVQRERAVSPADLEIRARELRLSLEKRYRQLVHDHQLSGGLHGTDVTNDVLPYISEGIPFDHAEELLRLAGFVVGRRPDPNNPPPEANRAKDWYAVVAKISPFVNQLGTKVDLYISLLPRVPGDYSSVDKVSAVFFVSTP